jgi:hypothetical protein
VRRAKKIRGVHLAVTLVCYTNSNARIPTAAFSRKPGRSSRRRLPPKSRDDPRYALRRASDVRTPPMKKGHPTGWPFGFEELK